ncbi:hypothetical protein [Ferruginibacter sp. SUN106]|uniref:hypothetical protein n=1 Tax=Ferruginibacter sp. SUN106 TaxID=2978348 RepID=UPI003D3633D7
MAALKNYFFPFLMMALFSPAKAQVSCADLRDRNGELLQSLSVYEAIVSPTQKDFDQFTTAYNKFRDYAIKAAATETDYDIKLLLQVFALQTANHYLAAAGKQSKFDMAWKEMKYIYDNLYSNINYQKLNRKDNFISCDLSGEQKRLIIYESAYKDLCTEFIGISCNIIAHFKRDDVAVAIFSKAGFKGLLTTGSLLHSTAADILIRRLNKGLADDTSYLAAYKFICTNNNSFSLASISSDFGNMTFAKALDVLINPVLVARTNMEPIKNMDDFGKTSLRYDYLYNYLSKDSGFTFAQKFDLLRIALDDYLAEMRSIKIDNHSFWHVPLLYQMLDAGYESGDGYSVRKGLRDILNSNNTALISELAQVYELYGKYCYGYYPNIEKAHYYYSAYVCYRALGDNKKANKAYNDIPRSMLANKKSDGYRKLD